jgi:outer membrane protein assembly factor BamB
VHVLRAEDGSEVWSDVVMGAQRQAAISVFTGIGGDPVSADGILYVAGSAGQFASFQLETGRRLWEQPISSVNMPWLAGDMVYVLTTDAQVIAMNRMDGRVKFVTQLPLYVNEETKQARFSWSGPVMAGNRLLVAGAHGEMAEINPQDGSVMMTEIPDGVYTPPVVALGAAFMMTDSAKLYALY